MADRAKFLDFMDMLDGGGRGQMGGEFEGGGIISQIANLLATPYGSEDAGRRERLQASRRARGLLDMDAIGTKEEQEAAAERAAATPSVVKRSVPEVTSSPRPQLRPAAPVGKTMDQAVGGAQYPSMYRSMDSVVGGMGVPAAPVGKTMDQAVGGAQYPSMYRSMDSRVGLLQQAQGSPSPRGGHSALVDAYGMMAGGNMRNNNISSQMDRYLPASMSMGQTSTMPQPNMPAPAAFSANPPSTAAMTSATPAPADRNSRLQAFNAAMATVPQMLQGTEIASMYRDHLLNGGGGTFAQFTGAQ